LGSEFERFDRGVRTGEARRFSILSVQEIFGADFPKNCPKMRWRSRLRWFFGSELLREYRKFFDNFENGGEKAEAREAQGR
jgi:hypothetical protein